MLSIALTENLHKYKSLPHKLANIYVKEGALICGADATAVSCGTYKNEELCALGASCDATSCLIDAFI